MRKATVEIFSDATNAAVIRHPERRFPGVLVQGDTLYALWQQAENVCRMAGKESPIYSELDSLRADLRSLIDHYKAVLARHQMDPPFSSHG